MATTVSVDLRTSTGVAAATLVIAPTRDDRNHGFIVEDGEYQFEVENKVDGPSVISLGPEEMFSIDRALTDVDAPTRGRLRPRSFVGAVEVTAELHDGERLTGWLDIRSRKLDHETRYRWMLAGIAEDGAELLLRSFSPSEIALRADHTRGPQALYQQLAFLAAIMARPHTVEAVERVLRNPYVSYRDDPVERPVGRGVSGSSRTVRALTTPGPRQPVRSGLVTGTLPSTIADLRPEATIDNVPNQYVRFVLDHWAAVLDQAAVALRGDTPADRRGRREVEELRTIVDRWRFDPRLSDVGRLRVAPGSDQAVHRRPGYRELHQAFVESQAAAMLTWDGGDDVHRAGQRDAALLYEYWCYLELRRIVERNCTWVDVRNLVEVTPDGLHLVLKRGRHQVVDGSVVHRGRRIDVELWFNRSFGRAESWTLQMRPDCSLRFSAQTAGSDPVSTWVHFDAKYKVDAAKDLFVDDDELTDDGAARRAERAATRADLLKMHAYHDAIRSSAGSYVLFPGNAPVRKAKHGEVLPGLGAVPFVPASDGHATRASAGVVEDLFIEILDHVAHQASSRERSTWWEREANRTHIGPVSEFIPLDRPPSDVTVLIGYCRSAEHRRWIEDGGRYNMRFGDRRGSVLRTGAEAAAVTLLLWGPDSSDVRAWTLTDHLEEASAEEMRGLRYPSTPRGSYLLRTLDRPFEIPTALDRRCIDALTEGTLHGSPVASDWGSVLHAMSEVSARGSSTPDRESASRPD